MTEEWIPLMQEHGYMLGIVAMLFSYMLKKDREHRKERKEWRELMEKQHKETMVLTESTKEEIHALNNVFTQLKIILDMLVKQSKN